MPRLESSLTAKTARGYSRGVAPAAIIDIKLLGGLEVRRDGEIVPLPQSKKTRALLAYLILKGTPQRRDALCELLWEIPDDPRGALRWSLSKLRPIVNDEGCERLTADRERVAFAGKDARIDFMRVLESAETLDRLPRAALVELCNACSGTLLAGLELPGQPAYESWRLGQQDKARRLHLRVVEELIRREAGASEERASLLRRLIELDPDNEDAHVRLVACLAGTGRRADAEAQAEVSRSMLEAVGGFDPVRLTASLNAGGKPAAAAPAKPLREEPALRQDIRFCTARDGVRIAYATVGSGPPLVKAANWLNHLEFDWESPIWRHMFHAFAQDHTFIRYDSRGNGLSDWEVADLSLDARVEDLKAAVDAAGVERFPLLGISQGCAISVEFAVRYPERVSKLILFGGYARGWCFGTSEVVERTRALMTITRTGWGGDNPAYRQLFTSLFIPGGSPEQMGWFNELQRRTTSPENAARIIEAHGHFDVSASLGKVKAPTLVMHVRDDACVPYANGRQLAAGIPGARFVTLEGQNHLLLESEPAWGKFLAEMRAFLAE